MNHTILVAVDIRSTHNVGSLLRTCDGLGIDRVYLCGICPYPLIKDGKDTRLPHIAKRASDTIHKTALGAEESVDWQHYADTKNCLIELKKQGYWVCALEQTPNSVPLVEYKRPKKLALIVGTEVTGLPNEIIKLCDDAIEIPMQGKKESFNVSVAAAIALFWITKDSTTT